MLLCVHVIYVGSFDMVILIGTPEHTHTHTTRTHKCTRTMGANFTPHIWLSTSHMAVNSNYFKGHHIWLSIPHRDELWVPISHITYGC